MDLHIRGSMVLLALSSAEGTLSLIFQPHIIISRGHRSLGGVLRNLFDPNSQYRTLEMTRKRCGDGSVLAEMSPLAHLQNVP